MVRASTIFVAAIALAPVVLAAPLTEEITQELAARSIEETPAELEARKFGKFLKKFKGIAKLAVNTVAPGAGAFIPRELEDVVADVEAREPEPAHPAGRGPAHPTAGHPHPHAPAAHPHARAPAHAHAAARGGKSALHHGARGGPKHARGNARRGKASTTKKHGKSKKSKGGKHGKKGKGKGIKGKGSKSKGGKGKKASLKRSHPRDVEDDLSLDARDFVEVESDFEARDVATDSDLSLEAREALFESTIDDLVARGYIEIVEDIDGREPRLKLGNFFKKVGGVAQKVTHVAGKVASVGAALGMRDVEDGLEVEVREDAEDLDARFDMEESVLDQLD